MTFCSRLRITSKAKCGGAAFAAARMSSWTGLPWVMPQVAFGSPMRVASWSTSTVSSPASPGVTSFGPPLKPAKKCGSTKPVVIRRSASTQREQTCTGTPLPCSPR